MAELAREGPPRSLDMMMPGQPVAMARPRVVYSHGRAHAYTPELTRLAVERWTLLARNAMHGRTRFVGPVVLEVEAVMRQPTGRRRFPWPDVKPDLSNIIKLCEDGLAPVWGDDAQVVKIEAVKRYARAGEEPHCRVTIREAEDG